MKKPIIFLNVICLTNPHSILVINRYIFESENRNMHQRNNPNVTTSGYSSSTNPSNISPNEIVGARLVAFSSKSLNTINNIEHRYVPHPPIETDFIFELGLIAFKIISLFLQYLLLYKSEKWVGPSTISTDSF